MSPREAHTNEQIDDAAKWLRELPPAEKTRKASSRMEVIRQLRGEITDALKRGYDHAQIAEGLSAKGVKITANTLKNYLQRSKGTSGKKLTRRSANESGHKAEASANTSQKTAQSSGSATKPTEPTQTTKGGTDGRQNTAATTEGPSEAKQHTKREYSADNASFTPRPDRGKL